MIQWAPGNRTTITAISAAAIFAFLIVNELHRLVSAEWVPVIVRAALVLLGLSIHYLRDALRRMDEQLKKIETAVIKPESERHSI
ncbi:MAG: hypothetical protein RMJ19_05570 [Gemmatales bacterium]|nr:hypothetical protein [Gemmatales bacterium]MDW8175122.1 hypothetical protein [Gemmatales bacterium]